MEEGELVMLCLWYVTLALIYAARMLPAVAQPCRDAELAADRLLESIADVSYQQLPGQECCVVCMEEYEHGERCFPRGFAKATPPAHSAEHPLPFRRHNTPGTFACVYSSSPEPAAWSKPPSSTPATTTSATRSTSSARGGRVCPLATRAMTVVSLPPASAVHNNQRIALTTTVDGYSLCLWSSMDGGGGGGVLSFPIIRAYTLGWRE
ncbi:hypothetical protein HU200_050036 [Digitaria exilis]|uniref:Uncharacterized protein n=1 Tax=Digitaria exilis TaxID=1010633 RepID=A0A835AU37_9POAL|nr:hypothetical protein HU200_050036 [Digitaria exilis]